MTSPLSSPDLSDALPLAAGPVLAPADDAAHAPALDADSPVLEAAETAALAEGWVRPLRGLRAERAAETASQAAVSKTPVSFVLPPLDVPVATLAALAPPADALPGSAAKAGPGSTGPGTAGITTLAIPSDTLFPNQWHLNNTGQSGGTPGLDINVTRVWDEFSGAGVTVGIWDDGVQYTHHDLNDNYDTSLHLNLGGLVHDPAPENANSRHGTAVAGLIAAENNGSGTVGVAWGATIAGVDMFEDPSLDFEGSMYELDNFDITNHSWGYITPFAANILDAGWTNFFGGWIESVQTGRGGLGTINLKAAGNDRADGRDANDSNLNNMPQTIAVAAVSHDDNVSWYSTPGAAVLIAATSNGATGAGMWTTDRTGADGYSTGANEAGNINADYTSTFGGTSSATPVTAGVVALMLEANPNLGWRDVQTILANTARHVGSDIGTAPVGNELYSWAVNGATTWNGGGMHFSNDYGYGLVDALAAVRMAESWTEQNTSTNWQNVTAGSWSGSLFIPDDSMTGVSVSFTVTEDMDLEHVALRLDWDGGYTGDYLVTLTSPDGTTSILSRPLNGGDSSTNSWVFTSNQFRGELSTGTWTVQVADLWAAVTSSLIAAQLQFYGATKDADDTWIFTNEFSELAGGAHGHGTAIHDTNGGVDTLNASAVTAAAAIDLQAGMGIVDGVGITLSGIEHVVSGDDNDMLYGDAADNHLRAMRGNDLLRGAGGQDTLEGGQGNDTLSGGAGNDRLDGGLGVDTADYSAATARVVVELSQGPVAQLISAAEGTDTLVDIENVRGGAGGDRILGTPGANRLEGNDGDDNLFGLGGNDIIVGGAGNDGLYGAPGDDLLQGGDGNDRIFAGTGNDTLNGGAGVDFADYRAATGTGVTVSLALQGGAQLVSATEGSDTLLNIENLFGSNFDDTFTGDAFDNVIYGLGGNDTITGGAGVDRIFSGGGADRLTGGADMDVFFYTRASDSSTAAGQDVITDFLSGTDKINLAAFDANANLAGVQDFTIIGSAPFTGVAGQLRFTTNGINGFVTADITGNGVADFSLALLGVTSVAAGDFIL